MSRYRKSGERDRVRRPGNGPASGIDRRTFLTAAGTVAAAAGAPGARAAQLPPDATINPPTVAARDRLDQVPFGIDQDEGWYTILTTTPSDKPIRNAGLGLVAYTWEENGPPLAVREGRTRLEDEIAKLASLPFADVLYIRCDWRDVQREPGRLDLAPVWKATFDAARASGLRVAFRVQLSNPETQPKALALPDYLQTQVPLVTIRRPAGGKTYVEPRYDHPAFARAFQDLNRLLAERFDGDALVEFVDLMMYGFWGEGHTSDYAHPFPDGATAERTFLEMTRWQLDAWTKTPLTVNTQPDISRVGNVAVQQLAIREGCWLRSDSIILDEPIQIDMLSGRPPWLAVVMEDGYHRHYRTDRPSYTIDAAGVDVIEQRLLHVIDLGGNYWSLWTEADNLRRYYERRPAAFDALRRRIGYRVRPSWVWQRKREGAPELVVAFANDGAAGVPGVLRVRVETLDGKALAGGALDAGQPRAGRLRQASFRLPRGLEGAELRLLADIDIRGRRSPVTWATAQPLDDRGGVRVKLLPQNASAWRKGI
jgi:hypothetical protein